MLNKHLAYKSFNRQLIIVLIIDLGSFITGCMHGWPAPALVKLKSGSEFINITTDEGSWLALYPEFGHFIAPVPFGIMSDMVGRKPILIFSSFIALVGWGITLFAKNLNYFIIGRILHGFNFGIHCSITNVYVAEICNKEIRGTFGSTVYLFHGLGVLFQFLIGGYFSLWFIAFFTFLICCLYFFSIFFIVESPYYLAAVQKTEESKINLMWLKATSDNHVIDREFLNITKRVEIKENFFKSCKNLILTTNRTGFILCILLSWLNDMTGRIPVLTYVTENFKSLSSTSANNFTILLGFCNALLPFFTIFLSEKFGRKIIVEITAVIGGIALLICGLLYFFNLKINLVIFMYDWILFIGVTTYICSCSMFTANILTLRGELISENSRGLASGFVSMTFAFATMIAIKVFQRVRDSYGIYYAFWILSAFNFILAIFTAVFVPETKNKSFEEIQNAFRSKNNLSLKSSTNNFTLD